MEFSTFLKFGLYPNKELTRGGYDKIRYGIQLPLFSVCNKKKNVLTVYKGAEELPRTISIIFSQYFACN